MLFVFDYLIAMIKLIVIIMKLLSIESDSKTTKGSEFGFLTGIQYFKPSFKICPHATKGCMAGCLNTAGRGIMSNVQQARHNRTVFALTQPEAYAKQLDEEIVSLIKKAKKQNKKACLRLNGTSDINWESNPLVSNVLRKHKKSLNIYDYTKDVDKAKKQHKKLIHYTVSYHENMAQETVKELIDMGINVAVVFRNAELPKKWLGVKVINGDKHDLRFKDTKGRIVGLKAKGKAKKDKSGFVVDA